MNLGNLCFLNATLQALLSCSPFVQLLQNLCSRNVPKIGYPTLNAFVKFFTDFRVPDETKAKQLGRGYPESGKPFSPVMFDPVLKNFTPDIPTSLLGRPSYEASSPSFYDKASATVQPFLLLHLDILPDTVHTIEDTLHLYSAPETLEGYRASAGKAGVVSASKSVKIQTLSKILILHLMRFSYGSSGSAKLLKSVHFPLELILARDLLVTPALAGRKYELMATITHHGQEPSKGHCPADARYSDGRWLRHDDSSVTAVGPNRVFHDQAYVLFYKQV